MSMAAATHDVFYNSLTRDTFKSKLMKNFCARRNETLFCNSSDSFFEIMVICCY